MTILQTGWCLCSTCFCLAKTFMNKTNNECITGHAKSSAQCNYTKKKNDASHVLKWCTSHILPRKTKNQRVVSKKNVRCLITYFYCCFCPMLFCFILGSWRIVLDSCNRRTSPPPKHQKRSTSVCCVQTYHHILYHHQQHHHHHDMFRPWIVNISKGIQVSLWCPSDVGYGWVREYVLKEWTPKSSRKLVDSSNCTVRRLISCTTSLVCTVGWKLVPTWSVKVISCNSLQAPPGSKKWQSFSMIACFCLTLKNRSVVEGEEYLFGKTLKVTGLWHSVKVSGEDWEKKCIMALWYNLTSQGRLQMELLPVQDTSGYSNPQHFYYPSGSWKQTAFKKSRPITLQTLYNINPHLGSNYVTKCPLLKKNGCFKRQNPHKCTCTYICVSYIYIYMYIYKCHMYIYTVL